MYAQRHALIERHAFAEQQPRARYLTETGRASQAATSRLMSTDRLATPIAPAVRMERGNDTAATERAEQSAPTRQGRVPFGLHSQVRAGATA
jgi:hypothetical protein